MDAVKLNLSSASEKELSCLENYAEQMLMWCDDSFDQDDTLLDTGPAILSRGC